MATNYAKLTTEERIRKQLKFIETVRKKLSIVEEEFAKTKDVKDKMWIKCTLEMLITEETIIKDLEVTRMNERYHENLNKQYYEMIRKNVAL